MILQNQHLPNIEKNPYCGVSLKYAMEGLFSYHFKIDTTEYRIVYELYIELSLAAVIMVGPRERFYDRLKRRIEKK